jgi:branched-chain amino acid transport system ATP-binding protein
MCSHWTPDWEWVPAVGERSAGTSPVLSVSEINVSFGGTRAVSEVSLGLTEGTITGLIGPNGAGKTTLFNVITGMQRATSGRVVLDGVDITRSSPAKRAHRGLARTFQRLELFMTLSVRDNIRVAGDIVNANRRLGVDVEAETERLLDLTGLTAVADLDVSDIPTGQARVVEVARALMTQPRLLLLDEPASGQTEAETDDFAAMLETLVGQGLTICLVEHDLPLVMRLCSTIHVLDQGRLIASGTPGEVRAEPAVIAAYIGEDKAS